MPFPQIITDTGPFLKTNKHSYVGPFYSGGGYTYTVLKDGLNGTQVWRSTLPGTNAWTQQSTTWTSIGAEIFGMSVAQDKNDVNRLRIAVLSETIGMTTDMWLEIRDFTMYNGTTEAGWGAPTTIVNGVLSGGLVIPESGCVLKQGNGSDFNWCIVYSGEREKVMGTDYERIRFAYERGAGWVPGLQIDTGGEFNFSGPNSAVGSSERVHVLYSRRDVDLRHRSLKWNGSTFGRDTAQTVSTATEGGRGIFWVDGVNTEVMFAAHAPVTLGFAVHAAVSQADPSLTVTQTSNATRRGFGMATKAANEVFQVYWKNGTPADLQYKKWTDVAGWDTSPTVIHGNVPPPATSGPHVSTRFRGNVLMIVYDGGVNPQRPTYTEVDLGGPQTVDVTALLTSAFPMTATLQATANASALLAQALALAASGSLNILEDATITASFPLSAAADATIDAASTLAHAHGLTATALAEVAAQAALTQALALTPTAQAGVEAFAVLSSAALALDAAGGLVFDGDITLTSDHALASIADALIEAAALLTAAHTLAGAAEALAETTTDLASAHALNAQALAEAAASALLASSTALDANADALAEASALLSHAQALLSAGALVHDEAAMLDAGMSLVTDPGAVAEALTALNAVVALTVVGEAGVVEEAAVSVALSLGLDAQALVEAAAQVVLSKSTMLTTSADVVAESAAAIGAVYGLLVGGGLSVDDAVVMAAALGLDAAAFLDASVSASLAASLGADIAATVAAEAQMTANVAAAVATLAAVVVEAGLTMDALTSLTITGQGVLVGLVTPADRTLIVGAEDRVLEVSVDLRTLIVSVDERTIDT